MAKAAFNKQKGPLYKEIEIRLKEPTSKVATFGA